MTPRFLLSGYYGFNNLGDEALLEIIVEQLRRRFPGCGVDVLSNDPAATARTYGVESTPRANLRAVRAAVNLPVLRKDFMLVPWQIWESYVMGADCILLIMAALSNQAARDLEAIARDLDLDILVEVHNRVELDRALGLQTSLIGVNNRNLKTLKTDLQVTVDLAPFVPPDRLLVTESGLRTHADVKRMGEAGAQCLLVGESLLRQPDVGAAVHALLGTDA